jgi:hypothetical protein
VQYRDAFVEVSSRADTKTSFREGHGSGAVAVLGELGARGFSLVIVDPSRRAYVPG